MFLSKVHILSSSNKTFSVIMANKVTDEDLTTESDMEPLWKLCLICLFCVCFFVFLVLAFFILVIIFIYLFIY